MNAEKERHRRHLDDDERELWGSVTRTLKPLRPAEKRTAGPIAAEGEGRRPANNAVAAALMGAMPAKSGPPPLAPLGRRFTQQIGRGKHPIDARLDLHGMTLERAHAALLSFLYRAHAAEAKIVLVITGKGDTLGDPSRERGVLRRQVPLWLKLPEFRTLVVGFEPAHVGHGGEGALYVRIRRRGAR